MNRRGIIVHRDQYIQEEEAKEKEPGHCVEEDDRGAEILEGTILSIPVKFECV